MSRIQERATAVQEQHCFIDDVRASDRHSIESRSSRRKSTIATPSLCFHQLSRQAYKRNLSNQQALSIGTNIDSDTASNTPAIMDENLASTSHSDIFRAYMNRQADTSKPSSPAAMSIAEDTLKAQFYVVRQNGGATPLIAIDELPAHIIIEGVPRLLSIDDIDSMVRMPGKFEPRHKMFSVSDNSKPSTTAVDEKVEMGFGYPKPKPIAESPKLNKSEVFPGPKKYFGIEEIAPEEPQQSAPVDVVSKNDTEAQGFDPIPRWKGTQNLGGRRPLKGKKVYCSHWMSTGECDYAQQGCMYKHEMPLDIEMLQQLGFRDIPKWYRERHGIGKLTAIPGSGAHIEGPTVPPSHMHPSWRPILHQRLPRATPLATARSGNVYRRPNASSVLAPRPVRALPQELISLASRPVTPSLAGENPGKSLLESRFAPLQPNGDKGKSKDAASNKDDSSSPESAYAHLSTDPHITPNTSVESLPHKGIDPNDLQYRMRNMNLSRRTSVATDYETGLYEEQKERDDQEMQAAAELSAITASKREQESLKAKQDAALAIARQNVQRPGASQYLEQAVVRAKKAAKAQRNNAARAAARRGSAAKRNHEVVIA